MSLTSETHFFFTTEEINISVNIDSNNLYNPRLFTEENEGGRVWIGV